MTGNRAGTNEFTWVQVFAMLGFVAALFGVAVHSINSSIAANAAVIGARFDDVDGRLDRVEARIDERFDELEANVDVNTTFTSAFEGKRILTFGARDSS